MIAEFVKRFMDGRPRLEAMFAEEHPDNYRAIVEAVVSVLNNGEDSEAPDPKRIHELDDGNAQGTLVFVIADSGCPPREYWYVKVCYGSCGGCDTLKSIRDCRDKKPTAEQIADYMTLALHVVQGMKKMGDDDA